ncbi:MAG: hypothetical protein IKN56_00815 [Clostridia bacterium]|nr:hypothetical protein [Clostridia bacterium]
MKKSNLTRVTAVTMAAIVTGLTFFTYFSLSASAADTLPYIDTIRNAKSVSGTSYNIVEIAPTNTTGTMGYYAKGQEPGFVSNWERVISEMTSKEARESFASGLFTDLERHGLMKNGDPVPTPPNLSNEKHPLYKTGNYAEHLPWEETDFDAESFNKENQFDGKDHILNLTAPEVFNTKGVVEMVDDSSGAYNAEYSYRLANGTNIFDVNAWFDSTGKQSDFLQFENAQGYITTEPSTSAVVVNINTSGSDRMKRLGNNPNASSLISVNPNTKYTVYFNAVLEPASEGSAMGGELKVYGYTGSYSLISPAPSGEIEFAENGPQSFTFTTPADIGFIELCFGGSGNGKVRFENLLISTGDTSAEYVQDISYFEYGALDPEPTLGKNLFVFQKWAENSNSSVFNSSAAAVSGNEINIDRINEKVSVKSGVTDDLYTRYGASENYYFMAVEPGAEYEISVNFKVNSGMAQFYVFGYKDGMAADKSYNSNAVVKNYDKSVSDTYTDRVTLNDETKYLQIRVGTRQANADVEISDISIKKVIYPEYYYYDVSVHDEYKYENANSALPYENAAVYTKDSEGRFVFEGFYYLDGSGISRFENN